MYADLLKEEYAFRFADSPCLLIPKTALYLPDMTGADHQHAESALPNATAHSLGQFTVEKHSVKGKLSSFSAAGVFKLTL